MLEIPFLDEIVTEKTRETAQRAIVTFLEARFGDLPRDLIEEIESAVDEKHLNRLVRLAATCTDLEAFRDAMDRS